MRFRSIDCDGADERARWFDAPNGNARPSDVTFDGTDGNARPSHVTFDGRDGNARRFHATFDGTHANATRSHDEFTIGLPALWQPRLQSK